MPLRKFKGIAPALAIVHALFGSPASAQPETIPTPCAFSGDDTQQALGMRFKWRPPAQNDVPGLRAASCMGMGDGHNVSLTIEQLWADPKTSKRRFDAFMKLEFADAKPLPGDADGARWSEDGALKMVRLAYVRGHVLTKLSAHGVTKEQFAEMRTGMLKLRRLP